MMFIAMKSDIKLSSNWYTRSFITLSCYITKVTKYKVSANLKIIGCYKYILSYVIFPCIYDLFTCSQRSRVCIVNDRYCLNKTWFFLLLIQTIITRDVVTIREVVFTDTTQLGHTSKFISAIQVTLNNFVNTRTVRANIVLLQ